MSLIYALNKLKYFTNDHPHLLNEDQRNTSKRWPSFKKLLFMISFALLNDDAEKNENSNESTLSSIKTNNETDTIPKLQTETDIIICFNILIGRTRFFISDFKKFLKNSKLQPSINIQDHSDSSLKMIFLTEYNEILIYFEKFNEDMHFDKFAKTGDLSYFDGFFNCKINLSEQNEILTIYLDKFEHIGEFFKNYRKITNRFNAVSYKIITFIYLRQKSVEKLYTGMNTFFTNLIDAKTKYDNEEIEINMLKEEYKKLSLDLLKKFEFVYKVFVCMGDECHKDLFALYFMLEQYYGGNHFLKDKMISLGVTCEGYTCDGAVWSKAIEIFLIKHKKIFLKNFLLLCNKNEYQKEIDEIKKSKKKSLAALSEYVKQDIQAIDENYSDKTLWPHNIKLKWRRLIMKLQIKGKEIKNIEKFIEIILDGLDAFIIKKIELKAFCDTFICLLQDNMADDIRTCSETFAHTVSCKDNIKKNSDEKNSLIAEHKTRKNETTEVHPKTSETDVLHVYLEDFFEKHFSPEIREVIDQLEVMEQEITPELLGCEKLILELYFKLFTKVCDEKNDLFIFFLKEYIKRQNTITLKYVEFFNLDKNKYLSKIEDYLFLENFNVKLRDLQIDDNETNPIK